MKLTFETYSKESENCSKQCDLYDICGLHLNRVLGNLCPAKFSPLLKGIYYLKDREKVVIEKELKKNVYCSPNCSLCHSEEFENGHIEYNCSFMIDNDGEKIPRPSYECPVYKKTAGKYVLEGELKEILPKTDYTI